MHGASVGNAGIGGSQLCGLGPKICGGVCLETGMTRSGTKLKYRPAITAVLRRRGVYLHSTDRIDFLHTNNTGHRMPQAGMVLVHDTLLHMLIYTKERGAFTIGNYSDR